MKNSPTANLSGHRQFLTACAGCPEAIDHLRRRRLEGLRLGTQPDRLDPLAPDSFIHSIGDSFDFGKLRHSLTIFSKPETGSN